jgi:hypothetical protein|tara:strand:+ start:683 stop:793 length:111 start_codon:yes stop_codon:yes gene_type:complete
MKVKIEVELDTNDTGDVQLIEEFIEIVTELKEIQDE